MWKFVLISLALVQAIECRTNEDVINDFEPVFRERHEAFTALQNLTETTMIPRFMNLEREIFRQYEIIMGAQLPESVDRIQNNITEYTKEIGMDKYPELTKECMEDLDKAIENTRLTIVGEGRTCTMLPINQYAPIYFNNYTDIIKKMENEHYGLNVTREECVKLSTPFEVQTCVINDLYTFYIPYLKDVTDYTNSLIEDWTKQLNRIQNEVVLPCYAIIKNDINTHEEKIIGDTRICLWFIQKPKPQK